ncbi:tyrosine--tRNA ligase [Mollicutes bacterium LVI A0078]|nr:tyrosine--tRNA ligase [Mollicutes bacterium LVI A0075]WOO90939.1 tyrosine--tRNA ligase [Mollicutes bacterium LVI A0078]
MENIYNILDERGLIKDVTDEAIKERVNEPITLYCGFDPTGPTLHIGHLFPIILLKHFENAGHNPIAVIGGATGCIGDPSFKKDERSLNTYEVVEQYAESLTGQIKRFFDHDKTQFVNNMDWTSKISAIEFLRDYGKAFSVNNMIAKESVSSRMETGISFTEFSYPILQALDFKYLNDHYNCELQIGGSDQWGNITAGTELIRKTSDNKKVYGITVPLVTKSDGTKFGKSEGQAVWLDPNLTSPYEFYQFFMQSQDTDVIKYLKSFTFLPMEEISELEKQVESEPFKRTAQKVLAYEVTKFVHGQDMADTAVKVSEILFSGDLTRLSVEEIELNFKNVKMTDIASGTTLVDGLIECGLASSRRESREFITNNSISINGEKQSDLEYVLSESDGIGSKYVMIKRGKKKYEFVIIK